MKNIYFSLIAILFFLNASFVFGIDVDLTQTRYDYDLGKVGSPVRVGWVEITPETTGDISWSEKPSSADRGAVSGVNDLTRDFVYSRNAITLNHKIANGEWYITMEMGDGSFTSTSVYDNIKVEAEGSVISSDIDIEKGRLTTVTGKVTVADGELNITFSDNGGATPHWLLNRLTIAKKPYQNVTGTLQHPNGEVIRAAPMTFGKRYPGPLIYADNVNFWWAFKDLHYNAIRLTWVDALGSSNPNLDVWTFPELHAEMEKIVANANTTGMAVIFNYHYVGEQDDGRNPKGADYEMNYLEQFWTNVAPWFKDNPLVIFELQNEPTFSSSKYNNPIYKNRMLEIYRKVRVAAPERQIIVFSSPHHTYVNDLVTNNENDLDWDYTTIGYHLYNGGKSTSVQSGAEKHRVVCTEFDYSTEQHSYVAKVDGYAECSESLERIAQGWMDWSEHDGPFIAHSLLIPDAIKKGYQWWNNSGTTINWDFPLSNSMIFEGEDVVAKITATDSGSINNCTLFLNGIPVSTDNAAPFEWNDGVLKNMTSGNYVLRAEVRDNEGNLETSTRNFSVLPGTSAKTTVLNPTEDAYVRNNNTQDGSGMRLLSRHAHTSTDACKAILKFNLSEINASTVDAAKLRVYNTGEGDEGYITLHELLNDAWKESEVTFANSPKSTGIAGQLRDTRGGETAPDNQFSYKNQWVEFDVTAFINQELKDDKVVTFQYTNLLESQSRFLHRNETDLLFYFASRESDKAPQLVLSNVDGLTGNDASLSNREIFSNFRIYPNPAKGVANLQVYLEKAHDVRIALFNQLGQEVRTFAFDTQHSGENQMKMDISELNNGIYFAKLMVGTNTKTVKLLVKNE